MIDERKGIMKKFGKTVVTLGIIFVLILCCWGSTSVEAAAAQVPGLNARITESNVMKILNQYDPDGAYIMKKQKAAGDNILSWFSGGKIIDDIGVAVHEETHRYSFQKAPSGFAYYVGKKKTINVSFTTVYQSKEMASSIPKDLRTFRYNLYVAHPTGTLSSNIHGAYGMLNEFMAYRMSMNNAVSLYSYYADKNADWDTWSIFVNDCENGKMAYAEFKYYTLHYLYYAKKHHPQVYKGIVKNKQFCRAYRTMESSYRNLIGAYEKELQKLQTLMEGKGHALKIENDTIWLYKSGENGGTGTSRFTADYNKLQKELKKAKYTAIHKQLVNNGK